MKENLPFFLPTVHSLLKSRTVSLESTFTSFPHGRSFLGPSISWFHYLERRNLKLQCKHAAVTSFSFPQNGFLTDDDQKESEIILKCKTKSERVKLFH